MIQFIANGILSLSIGKLIIVTLLLTHITIISVTIFLHRSQAHRSVELSNAASHFFRFWLWLTTGMITKQWVAVHRKHHAKVETKDDPHSPIHHGIHKILWSGVKPYRVCAQSIDVITQYGHGTPDDFIERHLYTRFNWLGIIIMLIIDILLFGIKGLCTWIIQIGWIPFLAAGVINGLGHYLGYRNFEPKDASTNILPWGIIIGGEELHNNHHAYSDSAKLSVRWFEFDIGYAYIKILSFLGLAKVKRTIPRLSQATNAANDMQILNLVTKCSVNIIEKYRQQVIYHTVYSVVSRKRATIKKLNPKNLIVWMDREHNLLSKWKQGQLKQALQSHPHLKTVYQYRSKLSQIINDHSRSKKDIKDAIIEWCLEAKKSNIKALEDYSSWLFDLLNSQPAINR